MTVTEKSFGQTKNGKEVKIFTITNNKGNEAVVSEFGAVLVSLKIKNDKGESKDVVLGYESVKNYEANPAFFGGVIGPNANRIANGKFKIDGVEYNLPTNDGKNNLHSDFDIGYHKQLWKGEIVDNGVKLTYEKPDMLMGVPGNIKTSVTYTFNDDNELKIEYNAVSDKKTIVNLTNHSYFSLGGDGAGSDSVFDTLLTINASKFTEIDDGGIPTGKLIDVAGTPLDFTKPKKIGKEINADFKQMVMVKGYDHNYALDNYTGEVRKVAEATCDGRTMEVYTDLPGMQFYTGNWIDDNAGKGGKKGNLYKERGAFCLETQFFPNSCNDATFVSPVKGANEKYHSVTMYKFK
ncbi:aldose 1-epimerase [Anaeromyces robustus]|jgi:aldose 1-epimerase|uniref:Aldose 1-epimerase n=1 Tax=Anaeromyces robustus TaxID=1754192 RepID=A0A1Y1VT41_9FUNG|nr:aldose 1-epimerase [Anaeromyces robustus]|eukprot:ORX63914.1 aldose 1-epimerase [Anaeromyces robustus]